MFLPWTTLANDTVTAPISTNSNLLTLAPVRRSIDPLLTVAERYRWHQVSRRPDRRGLVLE